jgi:Na+-transporting NADH:ubiquinone oxidoreductase subunit B
MFLQKWDNLINIAKSGKGFIGKQKALLCALDTIIRKPDVVTRNAPHIREATDLKRIMILVVLALTPCTIFGIWNTGKNTYGSIGILDCSFFHAFSEGFLHVFPLILISYTIGGICEAIFAGSRDHDIAEGFLVTGLLYPLICPPTIPWWMFACGIAFGVVIGKELFGGTGMNIINPALLSRAFLFFAYPAAMSGDEVWIKKPFYENANGDILASSWTTIDRVLIDNFIINQNIDVISGQTPLALATSISSSGNVNNINDSINNIYSSIDMFIGVIPGSIGETSTIMCLFGAIVLITTRIASWRTMLGICLGALLTTSLFVTFCNSNTSNLLNISYINHFIMGGFAFGMVFMATDPVSGPLHKKSQYIYGFGIGMLCILIRAINPAFPEGMMLSILFMNVFSPLIDHYMTIFEVNRRQRRLACV